MNPTLQFTYQHPLFTQEDLEVIFAAHQQVTFSKNQLILKEGEVLDAYYILEKGLTRTFVHDYDNNEITTEFFTENEIVIVPSSLFQQIPSQENVQAITNCVLWKIEFNDFQKLFNEIEGFKDWGRLWFTFQLFEMKQRSLEIITKTAKDRYLKLMKEKPQIIQQAPLKQIASFLGITDTSLSRIRREV